MDTRSVVAAWLLLCGAIGGCGSSDEPPPQAAGAPSEAPPSPDDFAIKLRVKSEECYGSAGCNVTLGVEPLSARDGGIPDGRWDVTYKLKGITDGASVQTFTLDDGYFEDLTEEVVVTTAKRGAKVTAAVTSVTPG